MANLAIKGHPTRGKEVIEILEMLGGNNKYHINITECNLLYTIREGDDVIIGTYPNSSISQIYTLERFLEKFPHKVGDKVICRPYIGAREICEIKWDNNCVKYGIGVGEWFTTPSLQPYKEKTMKEQKAIPPYMDYDVRTEEPKELLIGFTKDNNGDWELSIHKDYEIKEVDGKFKLIKKKPQYPTTYEECCKVLGICADDCFSSGYKCSLLTEFQELLICRNAYWKTAGDEYQLGKPWKPNFTDLNEERYGMYTLANEIVCDYGGGDVNTILTFPTEEIRDTFYKNFKELIETCKELL